VILEFWIIASLLAQYLLLSNSISSAIRIRHVTILEHLKRKMRTAPSKAMIKSVESKIADIHVNPS